MSSLYEVVAAALGVDHTLINEDSGMDVTPNWDSLKNMILLTEVERTYDVEFDLDQLGKASSVRAIRGMLHMKGVETT